MRINRLQQPSRTETSYGEVKMNLFVPPGGKTKNWYVRVYVPAELLDFYKKSDFKQSTRTTDRVLAEARAAAFVLEKSREFLSKRELLKGYTTEQPQTVVLDASLIQKIAHIRLASLVREGEVPAFVTWSPIDVGYAAARIALSVIRNEEAIVGDAPLKVGRLGEVVVDKGGMASVASLITVDKANIDKYDDAF